MKHSKSSLFLMELIISILFFSLASTVCIQMFAKSHTLSKQTVDENHAMIQAQNLAECFLATEEEMNQTLYFDNNWKECTQEQAAYYAGILSHASENSMVTADIIVAPYPYTDSAIYTLSLQHHIPERRGNLE